jgi:hypothetical protein
MGLGRNSHKEATLHPDFYQQVAELPLSLPGPSTLEVSVWDYDLIGDDHIGSTFIDLEDRWFSPKWRNSSDRSNRPLEWRQLWSPSSLFPQGKLECLVEILPRSEANLFPCWDVSLPDRQDWECRVVVWKTRHVPASDPGGFSDLYLRLFMVKNKE